MNFLLFNLLITSLLFATYFLSKSIVQRSIVWAAQKNLFDPNDERKIHTEKISSLGGIGIFLSFVSFLILGSMVGLLSPNYIFSLILPAGLLFGIGLYDDLKPQPASIRLLVQIATAFGLYFAFGTSLNQLIDWLPFAKFVSPILIIVFTVGMINAFNFIDGINGLAGSMSTWISLSFSLCFFIIGDFQAAVCALVLASTLMGFLKYNYGKAKIFMGDNGSTVLGFLFSWMALKLIIGSTGIFDINLSYMIVFALLSLPLVDLGRVAFTRILSKRSPFSADRNHLHHLFLNLKFSHKETCRLILIWKFSLLGMVLIGSWTNLWLGAFLMAWVLIIPLVLILIFQSNIAKSIFPNHHRLSAK